MEMLHWLFQGFVVAVAPANLLMLVGGITVGMLVGAIPGISAANGIALLLPVAHAFDVSAQAAVILFAGVYYGAKYSGRISAVLSEIPGDVSSYATPFDGYPLARKGQAGMALVLTAVSSFAGTLTAVILLIFIGRYFADIGNYFGPPEYAVLIAFVFVLVLLLSSTRFIKNLVSLCLGLMMSVVGVDWATGVFRYTATLPELFDGIDFIIAIIGIFAISEMLLLLEKRLTKKDIITVEDKSGNILPQCWSLKFAYLRASMVGALIGLLPGSGTYVANFAAYRLEKKIGGGPAFGSGNLRGLIAPEAANSACAIGSFVPLLALGIPGSATTAVIHGALHHLNIDAGPMLCMSQPVLIWALIASMFLGNILLLVANTLLIRFFPKLLAVPAWVLIPMILVVAFVSVYAVNQSMISLVLMVVIGLFVYGLRKFSFPLAPLVLGFVLGTPFENNLRIALAIGNGSVAVFFQHSISLLIWLGVVLAIAGKIGFQWKKQP
jgi:putative tricarboxylic transport membrane protein